MKFIKHLLIGAVALACAVSAQAQFDNFAGQRTIDMIYPQSMTASGSNFCVDLHGFEGVAKIDITALTNGVGGAYTIQFFTTPDRTNYTALANFALATSNSVIYTNVDVIYNGGVFPGPMLATNIYQIPGTKTTPSAALAGFVTPYIIPAPFTNTGAITLGTVHTMIGFVIPDQQRYLTAAISITGVATNFISAVITAHKQQD